MKNSNLCEYATTVSFLLIALLFPPDFRAQNIAPSEVELQRKYEMAVKDAERVEPDEISRDLRAISRCDIDLKWKYESNEWQILVVTWMDSGTMEKFYKGNKGEALTLSRDIWVTIVPDVKNFCTAYSRTRDDLKLRLEQLLGLPPHSVKSNFVEFWVKPDDLFRPCPDPEITDHECAPDFPLSSFLTVSPIYVKWFNDLKSASYSGNPQPYPWTRLGYTYDWGDSLSHIGISEFVIRSGATVIFANAKPQTKEYCGNAG